MVLDSSGRRAGIDPRTGGYFADFLIYATAPDDPHQRIVIPAPIEGNYTFVVTGTSNGTYELTVSDVNETGYVVIAFVAHDIPVSSIAIHQFRVDWTALTSGQNGVIVQVDANGDGIFERTLTSDSELTRDEFLGISPPHVPVGGEWVPIEMQTLGPLNTLQMLALWEAFASAIAVAVSFVGVRRIKKRRH